MRVHLLWWVFAAFTTKQCPYDRCTTVFFLNRLRLELQTAPCEGIHRKVDMKGVFRVFLRNFDNDVNSDKRTRPKLQSPWQITNLHKALADRQLPLVVYDFTFHHPTSKQVQQWEAMEIFCWRVIYTKDLLLKNLGSCWPTILIFQKAPGHFQVFLLYSRLPKTLITFQPGHAPALRIDFPSPIACSHNL